MMQHRFKLLALLVVGLMSFAAINVQAQDEDETKARVIQIAAESEIFSDWLTGYPDYHSDAWGPDENSNWYVEFKIGEDGEWLGYAAVNEDTGEIQEAFAPKPLPTDVYQAQLPRVTAFAMADVEVLARLDNNLDLWDMYPDWNRWDATWDVAFYRGIEGLIVKLKIDENDNVIIEQFVDPNELSAEESADKQRNDAINIAYGADGVWQALDGRDTWSTFVEQQSDHVLSVSFAAEDTTLVTVIVDVNDEKVLKVQVD